MLVNLADGAYLDRKCKDRKGKIYFPFCEACVDDESKKNQDVKANQNSKSAQRENVVEEVNKCCLHLPGTKRYLDV